MIARPLLALAALALAAGLAHGQQRACSKADEAAADKAINRVIAWPQLHQAWKDFGHCDTGAVDELYTDAVLRLVVQWKDVQVFADTTTRDPQFKAFVHKHLRSPAASEDRDMVYSRAKASCPADLDAFCAELARVVESVK